MVAPFATMTDDFIEIAKIDMSRNEFIKRRGLLVLFMFLDL